MNLKAILLAIQALPAVIKALEIIARVSYPLVKPVIRKAIDDPKTDHDDRLMEQLDSIIIPKKK